MMIANILRYITGYKEPDSLDGSSQISSLRKYGWKRDLPDFRDEYHNFVSHNRGRFRGVDLRPGCPPVYNQGKLGSCTANAISAAYEYDQLTQDEPDPFCPSRLFIYYNERELEGNVNIDSGGHLRDGIKTIARIGVVPETEWPYDVKKFREKPDSKCYEDAKDHRAVKYRRVRQDLEQLKEALSRNYPFVFGFAVYESFEKDEVAKTGNMPMPSKEDKLLGGHAVMAVGYDDDRKVFIIRNSWGQDWGDEGYFYMPYKYIENQDLAADFWTVTRVRDV